MRGQQGLKGLLMHSSVYWVGIMVSKLIGFLLIPIYTHHLTPADYGSLELIILATDVAAMIFGIRLGAALFKFYHGAESDTQRRRVVTTAMYAIVVLALACIALLWLLAEQFSRAMFGGDQMVLAFRIVFFSAFAGVVVEMSLSYVRILERSMLFVAITWTQMLSMMLLNVYFIAYLQMGVLGAVLGTAVVMAVSCPLLAGWVLYQVRDRFDGDCLRKMVLYSAPLVPAALGMFVLHFSDRFFLNRYATLAEVGIYAIAYKFGFLISMVIAHPFNLIWGNRMHTFYRSDNRQRLYNQTLAGFALILVGSALGLSLFIPETLRVMTPEVYWPAAELVPVIALAYVFGGFNGLAAGPLYTEGRTVAVGLTYGTAAAANIVLNMLLIPPFGPWGAALATLLSFVLILACTLWVAGKYSTLRWEYGRALKPLLAACVLFAAAQAFSWQSAWMDVIYKALLLLCYIPFVLALRFLHQDEWQSLRTQILCWRRTIAHTLARLGP